MKCSCSTCFGTMPSSPSGLKLRTLLRGGGLTPWDSRIYHKKSKSCSDWKWIVQILLICGYFSKQEMFHSTADFAAMYEMGYVKAFCKMTDFRYLRWQSSNLEESKYLRTRWWLFSNGRKNSQHIVNVQEKS